MTITMTQESTPSREVPQGQRLDVGLLLRAAVESVGCDHAVAAAAIEYTPTYWTRALNGERGVILARLGGLPVDVQTGLLTRWAEALGLRVITPDPVLDQLAQLAAMLADNRVRVTLERI